MMINLLVFDYLNISIFADYHYQICLYLNIWIFAHHEYQVCLYHQPAHAVEPRTHLGEILAIKYIDATFIESAVLAIKYIGAISKEQFLGQKF